MHDRATDGIDRARQPAELSKQGTRARPPTLEPEPRALWGSAQVALVIAIALLMGTGAPASRVGTDGRPDADPASSRVPRPGSPQARRVGVGVDPALGGSGLVVSMLRAAAQRATVQHRVVPPGCQKSGLGR